MIPAPFIAEAREAFDEAYLRGDPPAQSDTCFKAALAVLSRHWPASDAPSVDLTEDQWTRFREYLDRKGWRCPEGSDNMRDIRAAFRAALATPAPAPAVRVVRVAVAESLRGLPFVEVTDGPDDDDEAFDALANHRNAPIRLCIAEIPVPIREVPVVQASVTGAGT